MILQKDMEEESNNSQRTASGTGFNVTEIERMKKLILSLQGNTGKPTGRVMISILLPSRGRPDNIKRLYQSILATARFPSEIEMIIRLDEDDPTKDELLDNPPPIATVFTGPRITLSKYWNECYDRAKGDILMHCGDDIIFRTEDWDTKVKETFDGYSDKIVFVYGNDGSGVHDGKFGTHGFIHRRWVETVGYFVPPYFSSDYNDTWLNDVAKLIGRHRHIDILTEHMHPDLNKGPLDQTHRDRIKRHFADNVGKIYQDKLNERRADAEKLRKVMDV